MTINAWATDQGSMFALPMERAIPEFPYSQEYVLQWDIATQQLTYKPSVGQNPAGGIYDPNVDYPSGTIGDFLTLLGSTESVLTGAGMIGFLQNGAGAIGRTVQSKLSDVVNVLDFGADPTGATDSTLALQRAINSLPAKGGTVTVPGGTYLLSSPLTLGNGNGGAGFSTKNGIKLIGEGGGFANTPSTEFQYVGPSVVDFLIKVQGRISDCKVQGIFLGLNGNIGGIYARAFSGCVFSDLKIVNPRTNTSGFQIMGGTAPTGNYNLFNSYDRIFMGLFSPDSAGLYMDGDYASTNDSWISQFELIRVETVAGAINASCARFRFVDSCTFTRCHFESSAEPTSAGAVFDASSNPGGGNDFPVGLAFYDCSIKNTVVIETPTQKIGINYFYGAGVYDNEVVPSHPRLLGYSALGTVFGPAAGFTHKKTVDQTVTNTTAATVVYTYALAAYFLGGASSYIPATGMLRVKHLGTYVNASGANANLTLTVNLGAGVLLTVPFVAIPTGATSRSVQLSFTLSLLNLSASTEIGDVTAILGAVASGAGTLAPAATVLVGANAAPGLAIDTTVANNLTLSVQHSVASGSIAYLHKNTLLEYF